ncbi:FAD binding domain-containing protein [Actinokineospora sp. G85]|uniref:FAD binding domain-containing protein n=1 Tax=Actinokineospora sp. G85 TaxID=3406626 RepID=UPI003C71A174
MDQNTVVEVRDPRLAGQWEPGDAWLGGGTHLFSEPHPGVRRLVDLARFGWDPVVTTPEALTLAATCTIAELSRFADGSALPVAPLVRRCCQAFLASFKVWNTATVGGNLCLGLPAGPVIALAAALDGGCLLLAPDGTARTVAAVDLVTGPGETVLTEGELLRSVTFPAAALRRRSAFRRASPHPHGRSAALVIATLGEEFALTVTASTPRPVRLRFPGVPGADELAAAVEDAVETWFDDVHGLPAWRRHMTLRLAEQARAELGEPR